MQTNEHAKNSSKQSKSNKSQRTSKDSRALHKTEVIDPRLKASRHAAQFMASPGRQFDTTSASRRNKGMRDRGLREKKA